MGVFHFRTLQTEGRLTFVNFDGKPSVEGMLPSDGKEEKEFDIFLFRDDSGSAIKRIENGKFAGEVIRTERGSRFTFFDRRARKAFSFFENGISPDSMVYYSINWSIGHFQDLLDMVFLHAGTVVMDGKVYLFIAPSGGGKSTICSLAGEKGLKVLDDETCVIKRKGKMYYAGLFPVWPLRGEPGKMREVGGMFFLSKSGENRVREMSPIEAVRRMMPEATCFNSNYMPESEKENNRRRIFDFLNGMTRSVDFKMLDFKKDAEVFSCLA